jgi:DICT domain-containing protein
MDSTHPDTTTTPLSDLVADVEASGQTLTLYNPTASDACLDAVESYFDVTTVSVRHDRTADGSPANFAVLHDGDEFLAACDIDVLSAAVDPAAAFESPAHPRAEPPAVLDAVDQSTFTEYGKRRMILASRDVEKRAWRVSASAIHVGFQEFSRLRTQLDLYGRLTEQLTVHLYGAPDWEPPLDNVVLHGYETPELRDHWFVVFEDAEVATEPGTCAILAEEREPNVYSGFWTGQRPVADRILDRLRSEYPVTGTPA